MRWAATIVALFVACVAQAGDTLYDRALADRFIVDGFCFSTGVVSVIPGSTNRTQGFAGHAFGWMTAPFGRYDSSVVLTQKTRLEIPATWINTGPTGTPYTICGWAYHPAAFVGLEVIAAQGAYTVYIEMQSGKLGTYSAGSGRIAVTQLMPTNKWSFLAVVYDGARIKLYTDGVLGLDSAFLNSDSAPNQPFVFGNYRAGANDIATMFNGYLSDWRIYKRALSQTELDLIMYRRKVKQ